MQPEAKFKRKLVEAFLKVHPGGWTAFVKALDKDGMPDLLLCRPGAPAVWLEAKVGDNDLSSAQKLTLSNMDRSGQRVLVIRCSSMDAPKHQRTLTLGTVVRAPRRFSVLHLYSGHWPELKTPTFWDQVYRL